MQDNFFENFLKLLANDISRFSVEFSMFIIGFSGVLLLVMTVFVRRKDESYESLTKSLGDKSTRKVLAELNKKSKEFVVNIETEKLLGTSIYLKENTDIFFEFLVKKNKENEYSKEEKKFRKKIKKYNSDLSLKFKRNIYNIFSEIKKNNQVAVSFFHLYFFAKNFPFYLESDLDGSFVLNIKDIDKDLIMEKLDKENSGFCFEDFFYFIVNRLNKHEFEMRRYMKIKEIFSGKIKLSSSVVEVKNEMKIPVHVSNEEKKKEIYYDFKRSKKAATRTEKKERVEQEEKKRVQREQQERVEQEEKKRVQREQQERVEQEEKKRNAKDLNKPYVDENGSYTNGNLENKKIANIDIQEQIKAVEDLKKKTTEEKPIHSENKKDLSNLESVLLGESETSFSVAKKTKNKKDFNPLNTFFTLFVEMVISKKCKNMKLIFIHEDRVYISCDIFHEMAKKKYSIDEKESVFKFSQSIVKKIRSTLKISDDNLDMKNISVTTAEDSFSSLLFFVASKSVFEKKSASKYLSKIKKVESLDIPESYKKIESSDYLKTRG